MVYFPSRRVALKRLLALAASAIASAAAAQVPVSAFRPIRLLWRKAIALHHLKSAHFRHCLAKC